MFFLMMGGTVFTTITATTVVAVAAVVALMLAVVPVEGYVYCNANDVLPSGTNFTSPNLTVDLKDCCNNCTELHLSYNTIGDIGAVAIAEALKNNNALISLDLDGNNIGDIGAVALAEALKGNTGLTALGLEYNNIGTTGAVTLWTAFKASTVLTTLDLSSNPGSKVFNALNSIADNTATTLDLSDANIGDIGAAALAEAATMETCV